MTTNLPPFASAVMQHYDEGVLAPAPINDKWPVVIGPGLSLAYVSSVYRLSLQGFRQQYVDLAEELLEKDPHAGGVLSKRILGVVSHDLSLRPAMTKAGSTDEKLATELHRFCSEAIESIPEFYSHIGSLQWALYYGIKGLENHWIKDGRGWMLDRLSDIHSRRLAYPAPMSWDLYVWDTGPVYPTFTTQFRPAPSNYGYGLRVGDFPGKFVVHAPKIRGTYPTREGLGRQLMYWMTLKLAASRGGVQYLERFAKPIPDVTYNTVDGKTQQSRAASDEDIANAKAAARAMGAGALADWVHPDSIGVQLLTPDANGGTAKLTYGEWISICDSQMSKGALGNTLTTEASSSGGSRALGNTQEKGELRVLKYDARLLAGTIRRDILAWMVALNFPKAPLRLVPHVVIPVEDAPNPTAIIDRASRAAKAGMPVDADKTAQDAGVHLIAPGDIRARRMIPIADQKSPSDFDQDLRERQQALELQYGPTTAPPPASDDTDEAGSNHVPDDTEPGADTTE